MPALPKRRLLKPASRSHAPFRQERLPLASRGIRPSSRFLSLSLVAFVLLASFLANGCGQKSISSSERRTITTEIVAAAEHVATPKPGVTIRPELAAPSSIPWEKPLATDHIYVTLTGDVEVTSLRQALESIARRHHLDLTESGGGVRRFDLAYHGELTYSVYVVAPLAARPLPTSSASNEGPRLAIIIDDLGNDQSAANALVSLPFPLTFSVLPHLPLSSEIAEEAYRRNDQVMLHLPMQSEGESSPSEGTKAEDIELRVGMSRGQVQELVNSMLDTVPHAIGVNNHQGSRATADPALMQAVMDDLRTRGLFFIDSRTTASTVAYDVARASGVRAASRKVFLDDTPTRQAVLTQLDLAAHDASRDGSAIAIGHPRPATIAVLAEELPRMEARGIRIVFVSDLATK